MVTSLTGLTSAGRRARIRDLPYDPQPLVAQPADWRGGVAERRAGPDRERVPAAAPADAGAPLLRAPAVVLGAVGVVGVGVPVAAPLPDVAVHVVQAEG